MKSPALAKRALKANKPSGFTFGSIAKIKPRKPNEKPYTGILTEPWPKWRVLTPPTDEELDNLIDAKLEALFAHFGIESGSAFSGGGTNMAAAWADLAFRLARRHVPGFRGEPRRRGTPARRQSDDVTLMMNVELLRRREGSSERKAIKAIVDQALLSGTEEALRKRFYRAKVKFAPLSLLLDGLAAAKGNNSLVNLLQEALCGDEKETFLSPD
jgi:hypothetical protein